MTNFNELGLADSILKAITSEGYETPTPIQAQVIPEMLTGRDVVGIAQTGTGKTAAFVLPLLHEIAERGVRPRPKTCGALILAPTRELAAQIADSVRAYGRFMRHSVTVVVGGVKPGPQIRTLAKGVDIVVATPGRLLDHMSTGAINLDITTTVILDEADQMMDLGFMPAIRKIMTRLPRKRRTLLFSATMPTQIRALANDFLHDAAEISVAPVSRPIDQIEQKVVMVEKPNKRSALVEILKDNNVERAIVFTRTKHGADKVCRHLNTAGIPADAIHGNKSQPQRERALAAFKSGNTRVLVATDIAARGIDVDDVSHVVNFELPNIPESYVHRIGRTARAGKSGVAISLCDSAERSLLRDIERLIGRTISPDGVSVPLEDDRSGGRGRPSGSKSRNRNRSKSRGKPRGERQEQRSDRPQGERAASGKPRSEKPRSDKPRSDRPSADRNAAAKPKSDNRDGGNRRDEAGDAGLVRMLSKVGEGRKRPQKPAGPGGAPPQRRNRSRRKVEA